MIVFCLIHTHYSLLMDRKGSNCYTNRCCINNVQLVFIFSLLSAMHILLVAGELIMLTWAQDLYLTLNYRACSLVRWQDVRLGTGSLWMKTDNVCVLSITAIACTLACETRDFKIAPNSGVQLVVEVDALVFLPKDELWLSWRGGGYVMNSGWWVNNTDISIRPLLNSRLQELVL